MLEDHNQLNDLLRNKDIPLFMQQKTPDLSISRSFQDIPIENLLRKSISLEAWKMNLMVVSEEYQYIIIAVEDKLHVYKFDLHALKFGATDGKS